MGSAPHVWLDSARDSRASAPGLVKLFLSCEPGDGVYPFEMPQRIYNRAQRAPIAGQIFNSYNGANPPTVDGYIPFFYTSGMNAPQSLPTLGVWDMAHGEFIGRFPGAPIHESAVAEWAATSPEDWEAWYGGTKPATPSLPPGFLPIGAGASIKNFAPMLTERDAWPVFDPTRYHLLAALVETPATDAPFNANMGASWMVQSLTAPISTRYRFGLDLSRRSTLYGFAGQGHASIDGGTLCVANSLAGLPLNATSPGRVLGIAAHYQPDGAGSAALSLYAWDALTDTWYTQAGTLHTAPAAFNVEGFMLQAAKCAGAIWLAANEPFPSLTVNLEAMFTQWLGTNAGRTIPAAFAALSP